MTLQPGALNTHSTSLTHALWRQCVADFRRELWIGGVGTSSLTIDFAVDSAAPADRVRLPGIHPEWLGLGHFTQAHDVRYAYVVGEMARGIASPAMVIAAIRAGFFGFLGSAGLRLPVVEAAIDEIEASLPQGATGWGTNLIHTPEAPEGERAFVELMLRRGVTRVSASAFMELSPQVVRYAATGLREDGEGRVHRRNHIFAKVSRPEVASAFLRPSPDATLDTLVAQGQLSAAEAALARRIAVASDITVEADSGGHTDNRPLTVLFPVIARLRARIWPDAPEWQQPRLGVAGGLGSPVAIATAFHLGADYVVTGSINQSAVESGLSAAGREMLATADLADVVMAPAADMFERGIKVQVLKRGTLFAARANRLYEIYRAHDSIDALPSADRIWLEDKVLGESFASAWQQTRHRLAQNNPALLAKADAEPRRQLALVCRRYLFFGSQWAREGNLARRADFQIWCGPAIGDFNNWVAGSALAAPQQRHVGDIGLALLEGACRHQRGAQLAALGVTVPWAAMDDLPCAPSDPQA
ncbi:MAG: hypothetical protein B7X08_06470 [Acidocella sp. 20-63-7]|nr:MAG: hypothetical protein B7X08_06470 [Acidocella sp. 20-63-7]